MHGRVGCLLLLLPWLGACRRAETARDTAGRLRLDRDGRTALDAPATASRCANDTTLAVTAMNTQVVGAIALRVPWPLDSVRVLTVLAPPPSQGAASVALRGLGDSAGPALVAVRGSVRLEPGRMLTGRIDVVAPTLPGAPDSVRLTGRLSNVAVNDDLCPGPTTP